LAQQAFAFFPPFVGAIPSLYVASGGFILEFVLGDSTRFSFIIHSV